MSIFLALQLFSSRASSAGKLINYLVEDGGHVVKGEAYAEIEVFSSVFTIGSKIINNFIRGKSI